MTTRTFTANLGKALAWIGLLAGLAAVASAEEAPPQPAPTPPGERELWVPTEHLQAVLKRLPRAVMLTPEQYRTLRRDARLGTAPGEPEETPPVSAALRSVHYRGELGTDVVAMTAEYLVECFTDDWSELPLALPRTQLAHLEVDDQTALRVAPPPQGENPHPVLVVRGKGRHTV
ncbi:MAG: hypothetical protein KDM64_10485, partial [Verrucomicrobiae bacterium]|nr:hypothetical protein [Verrucomicrobiae bacterium]